MNIMTQQDERNALIEILKRYDIEMDFTIFKPMAVDEMYTYLKEKLDEDTFSRVYLETKVIVRGAYNQYIHILRTMSSLEKTNGLEMKTSTKIFIACVSSKVVDDLISLMRELTSNDERKLFIRIKIKDLGDIHTNIAILDEFNDEDEEFKFLVLYYRILISHLSQAAKMFDIDIFEESEKIGLDYFISDRYGFPAEKKNEKSNIPKDFTTARQVLAISTLLSELNVNPNNSDKTEIARFIQMLTNKELGASRIQDTNIYKKYLSGTGKTDKNYTKDAEFVAGYFESLGLKELAKKLKS